MIINNNNNNHNNNNNNNSNNNNNNATTQNNRLIVILNNYGNGDNDNMNATTQNNRLILIIMTVIMISISTIITIFIPSSSRATPRRVVLPRAPPSSSLVRWANNNFDNLHFRNSLETKKET